MPISTSPNARERTEQRSRRDEQAAEDGPGLPKKGTFGGWRHHARSQPGLRAAYRGAIFTLGLLFITAGVGLAVLPGPLTIPPMLIGLWIWSTEFRFAKRFFDSFKAKAHAAWEHAKQRPLSSTLVTVGGLAAAGAAFWAVQHFALVDKAKNTIV